MNLFLPNTDLSFVNNTKEIKTMNANLINTITANVTANLTAEINKRLDGLVAAKVEAIVAARIDAALNVEAVQAAVDRALATTDIAARIDIVLREAAVEVTRGESAAVREYLLEHMTGGRHSNPGDMMQTIATHFISDNLYEMRREAASAIAASVIADASRVERVMDAVTNNIESSVVENMLTGSRAVSLRDSVLVRVSSALTAQLLAAE